MLCAGKSNAAGVREKLKAVYKHTAVYRYQVMLAIISRQHFENLSFEIPTDLKMAVFFGVSPYSLVC
jgi:Holliday junction resolvase RusA-like endonuclease